MKPPKCPICGSCHHLREPHAFSEEAPRQSITAAEPKPATSHRSVTHNLVTHTAATNVTHTDRSKAAERQARYRARHGATYRERHRELMRRLRASDACRPKLRFAALERDGFKCVYCGRGHKHDVALTVDHVLPKSRGGSNEMSNIVTACGERNIGKGSRELATLPETDPAAKVASPS